MKQMCVLISLNHLLKFYKEPLILIALKGTKTKT